MRKTALSILTCTLLAAAASVGAAEQMKPGLWEMTMKSDALKNMPKMSAQQLEQMRKMGVAIPQMQDGAMITQVCITKEMAQRDTPPMQANESGCQTKNHKRSGNGYSVDIVCDGRGMQGVGVAKGTFSGNTSFASTYEFKGTAHGQPANSRHETTGKWLSADCGKVMPMHQMAPKK